MAVTPQQQNQAFLREVQEEVRRDQIADFWRRYGLLVIGGIVVLLVAYAGALWWGAHQKDLAGRQGEQLDDVYANLASDQTAAAAKLIEPLKTSHVDGYRAMALFTDADLALKNAGTDQAKLKVASARFAAIAGDTSLPEPLRNMALLREVTAAYDSLPPQAAIDRLRPIASPGNPYFASAGELTAIAYLRLGRVDLARKIFSQVAADPATPDSIRSRVVQMAGATDAAAPTDSAKEQKTQ